MSASPLQVLLVEDNRAEAALLQEMLLADRPERFVVTWADRLGKALGLVGSGPVDVVLLDLTLPDSRGLATLERLQAAAPHLPVVIMTGLEDEDLANTAIRQGAQDYLVKGQADGRAVARSIQYAMDRRAAAEALQRAHDELERRVMERTEELRALTARLTQVQEEERRRIAAGLHDNVGQSLAAGRLKLHGLRASQDPAERERLGDELHQLLGDASREVRELTFELSSPVLNLLGLHAALEELCEHFQQRFGVELSVERQGDGEAPPQALRSCLYHCTRELLLNVVKHAEASQARVFVHEGADGIQVTVRDNGKGFDSRAPERPTTRAGGFGLRSVRERLRDAGGTLDIQSASGRGTTATLRVPRPKP